MQPYVPDTLPLTDLDYRLLLPLVGQANAALARYDGLLQGIPYADRTRRWVNSVRIRTG